MKLPEITQTLLAWYDARARILPWRENVSPYRVWVSEIMLQQTRVEAVKPYFERFLAALPTLESLASAPEERLLKLWEGLGYYNRVRNLQKAAKIVLEHHHGILPSSVSELRTLPGIGEYTAGAIASIAFGLPEPAVDGNVLRVFARLLELSGSMADSGMRRELSEALRRIYPADRCGDFTQSLMELGATVCLPNGQPLCAQCPLAEHCRACRNHTVSRYPEKEKKTLRRIEKKTVLLLRCGGRCGLRRRGREGVLAGLWEFPNLDGETACDSIRDMLKQWELEPVSIQKSANGKHIFSHLEWHMESLVIECREINREFRWVDRETLDREISLPAAWRGFVDAAFSTPEVP